MEKCIPVFQHSRIFPFKERRKMDKEVGTKVIQVCQSLIKMLESSFQGFRKLSEESFSRVEEARKEVQHHSTELAKFIISESTSSEKGKEWAKPYLSMASSLDRMTHNIEGIVDPLKAMVRDHILFSDRALREVNDIFQEAMNLLERLPDLILTQNKPLAQHIGEQVRSVFKIANGFSEEHEERLIQGICMPRSSPMYLGILESLKGVIAHTLEVSGKIVSLSSKSSPSPPPSPPRIEGNG
jgi:Na+/phosphate symporter